MKKAENASAPALSKVEKGMLLGGMRDHLAARVAAEDQTAGTGFLTLAVELGMDPRSVSVSRSQDEAFDAACAEWEGVISGILTERLRTNSMRSKDAKALLSVVERLDPTFSPPKSGGSGPSVLIDLSGKSSAELSELRTNLIRSLPEEDKVDEDMEWSLKRLP